MHIHYAIDFDAYLYKYIHDIAMCFLFFIHPPKNKRRYMYIP